MNFLHTEFTGGSECIALITLDAQANVMLLGDTNFHAYQQGGSFQYCGGWATRSPVRLVPPHHDRWHVVVDLGGRAGRIQAGIRVIHRDGVTAH
jgi:uncharacterized protein DUF1883